MTFFERIVIDIESCIRRNLSSDCNFTVDIASRDGYDFYSNALKVSRLNSVFQIESEFISDFELDNGFLNFKLNDAVFYEFLSEFDFDVIKSDDEFVKKISAYIQLAEIEKKLAGERSYPFVLTSDVRRLICLLMKYVSIHNEIKARILLVEVIQILEKLESSSKNLKYFVTTYEPLLIAVRGSLVKLNLL